MKSRKTIIILIFLFIMLFSNSIFAITGPFNKTMAVNKRVIVHTLSPPTFAKQGETSLHILPGIFWVSNEDFDSVAFGLGLNYCYYPGLFLFTSIGGVHSAIGHTDPTLSSSSYQFDGATYMIMGNVGLGYDVYQLLAHVLKGLGNSATNTVSEIYSHLSFPFLFGVLGYYYYTDYKAKNKNTGLVDHVEGNSFQFGGMYIGMDFAVKFKLFGAHLKLGPYFTYIGFLQNKDPELTINRSSGATETTTVSNIFDMFYGFDISLISNDDWAISLNAFGVGAGLLETEIIQSLTVKITVKL